VQIGDERLQVTAVEVEGERRSHLWRRFVVMYEGLDAYQRNAERRIPLVALMPVRVYATKPSNESP
jgi:hypothetical protein